MHLAIGSQQFRTVVALVHNGPGEDGSIRQANASRLRFKQSRPVTKVSSPGLDLDLSGEQSADVREKLFHFLLGEGERRHPFFNSSFAYKIRNFAVVMASKEG